MGKSRALASWAARARNSKKKIIHQRRMNSSPLRFSRAMYGPEPAQGLHWLVNLWPTRWRLTLMVG